MHIYMWVIKEDKAAAKILYSFIWHAMYMYTLHVDADLWCSSTVQSCVCILVRNVYLLRYMYMYMHVWKGML